MSSYYAQRRADGRDPVIQKLDQLAEEVQALTTEVEHLRRGDDDD